MSDADFNADDEMRRLLHSADPARSLTPASPEALASLLEDTMSQPANDAQPSRRGPSRLLLVGGIVAAASIAAVAIVFATDGGDSKATPPTSASHQTVTNLKAGAGAGKCMVPSAEFVAQQQLAFEGKVTSVKDGIVTFDPSHFFAGTPTDTVAVTQPDPGNSESVDFRAGEDYIVGANDGQVSMCLSGIASDDLRATYDAAFSK